jgi:probable HAF family extracellular repeat protein
MCSQCNREIGLRGVVQRPIYILLPLIGFMVLAPRVRAATYGVTDLGNLALYPNVNAYGINSSGQVVGSAFNNGATHAFLWQSGSGMQDLGTLETGVSSEAYGINDGGRVVGYSNLTGTSGHHAFLWQSGSGMQDLGTLAGTNSGASSTATGINRSGQVVGYSDTWYSGLQPPATPPETFLWQSGSGMSNLGSFEGPSGGSDSLNSQAAGINDNGQAVGFSEFYNGHFHNHAALWQAGMIRDLGTLNANDDSFARAISSGGQVAGYAGVTINSATSNHAFYWPGNGPLQNLGTLGGNYSYAYGVNNSGKVVGQSLLNDNITNHAFLWQSASGMVDLNTLIDPALGVTLTNSRCINDFGQIVADGFKSGDNRTHAFLLSPLPGDFNGNGAVDAADYVVWRKGLGTTYTQADYDVWRAHFGQTAGSGSGANANAAVPEPITLVLLMFAVASWCIRRVRAASKVPTTRQCVKRADNTPFSEGLYPRIMAADAACSLTTARVCNSESLVKPGRSPPRCVLSRRISKWKNGILSISVRRPT